MKFISILLVSSFSISMGSAFAADPIRIGVTTILSGPNADRGQSEKNAISLALQEINDSGGVLGRTVEAIYADNAADPALGVTVAKQLIEEQHVSVLLGALATPVTRAVMPIANAAKVPFVIDISAGQEFVDAAGIGGFPYVFKTSPSDGDVANAMMRWLSARSAKRIAIVSDENDFSHANALAMEKAAIAAHIDIAVNESIAKGTADLAPLLERMKALHVDSIVTLLSTSSAAFFRAYEQTNATIPLTGRIDFLAARANLSPQFLDSGGLNRAAGVSTFTPSTPDPVLERWITTYRKRFGLAATQRSVFAYEATQLIVDAIRRANTDNPTSIQKALASATMPSMLGGTYQMDEHNHAHLALQIVGIRGGEITVLERIGN